MTIHEFIKKRKHLIWYVRNYDKLNAEAIVEATLNYGDWNDVQRLIKILGIKLFQINFFILFCLSHHLHRRPAINLNLFLI